MQQVDFGIVQCWIGVLIARSIIIAEETRSGNNNKNNSLVNVSYSEWKINQQFTKSRIRLDHVMILTILVLVRMKIRSETR